MESIATLTAAGVDVSGDKYANLLNSYNLSQQAQAQQTIYSNMSADEKIQMAEWLSKGTGEDGETVAPNDERFSWWQKFCCVPNLDVEAARTAPIVIFVAIFFMLAYGSLFPHRDSVFFIAVDWFIGLICSYLFFFVTHKLTLAMSDLFKGKSKT